MRTRFLTPLVAAVVVGLAVLGYLGIQAHRRSEYVAAEKQLKAMPLPAGVTVAGTTAVGGVHFGCTPQPASRCLHAAASAGTVGPRFDRLLHATSDDCRTLPRGIGSCRVTGRIAGHAAYLIVFPHLYVTHGKIPAGAVGVVHGHFYSRGSDMILGLVDP
jgi:hypothetical protein